MFPINETVWNPCCKNFNKHVMIQYEIYNCCTLYFQMCSRLEVCCLLTNNIQGTLLYIIGSFQCS